MAEETKLNRTYPPSLKLLIPFWSFSGRRRQYPVSVHCCGWSECWQWWPHPHLRRYKLWAVKNPCALVLWAYTEGFKQFFQIEIYILFSRLKCQDIKICSFCQYPPPNVFTQFLSWQPQTSSLNGPLEYLHKKKPILFINGFLESTVGGVFVGLWQSDGTTKI